MDMDSVITQHSPLNGHTLPPPSDEFQRIEQAYAEIQRRDSQAEHRLWRSHQRELWLLMALLMAVGVLVWQHLDRRTVQAFVQVVVQDEKGQLLQVGVPQDLLAYTPPDGVVMDMLGEWVRKVRWRGTDPVLARAQWGWVFRHTCGQARRMLQALEDKEQPYKPSKKLVAVELRSVTKTPVPESYQVLWAETSTEPSNPTVKTQLWAGTFSVGRVKPPTMAEALENRLGLCATMYDLSPMPEGGIR